MRNDGCGKMDTGNYVKTLREMGAGGESSDFDNNIGIGINLATASFTPSDDIYYHPKCLGGKTLSSSGSQSCKNSNDRTNKKYHEYRKCIGDNAGGLFGFTGDVISNLANNSKNLLDFGSSEDDSCKLVYVETTNYVGSNKNRCCRGVYLKQKQIDSLNNCDYYDPSQKNKFDSCTLDDNYCQNFVNNIDTCKINDGETCGSEQSICCEGFRNKEDFSNIEKTTNYSRQIYLFSCGFILLYLFGQCMK